MSQRRVPPFDLNRLPRLGSQLATRPTMFDYLVTREERLWRSRTVFGWIASGRIKLGSTTARWWRRRRPRSRWPAGRRRARSSCSRAERAVRLDEYGGPGKNVFREG